MFSVQAFNQSNAHFFGNALVEQGKLRKRFCVDNRGWNRTVSGGMEHDEYDTPAAWYIICRDGGGRVWACNRFVPTTQPYMIEEQWPWLVEKDDLPKHPNIWEQSRFCIDDDLPRKYKGDLIKAMLTAQLEFNQVMGVQETWWMAEPSSVKFISDDVERLGPDKLVDGMVCFVGRSKYKHPDALQFVNWASDFEEAVA